jgi:hypothetical protein
MAGATSTERKVDQEIASWFTPMEACAYAATCVGVKGAADAIWQLLRGGMIQAIAASSSLTPKKESPLADANPSYIPKGLWQHLTDHGTNLWSGGYARFWVAKRNGSPSAYQCFGIKLNPDDVRANLPAPNPALHSPQPKAAPVQPPPVTNKGGRPRNDYWDDLWAEICGQIYDGASIPKRQADIERAMLDWATNHGHALSEAGARQRARILFDRLQKRG